MSLLIADPAGFPPAKGMGQLSAANVFIEEVPLDQLVAVSSAAGSGVPKNKRVNVTPGVTDMILNRTVGGASYITVQIQDRTRDVLRSKIFSLSDVMVMDGLNFALVQVAKQGDELQLQFEAALAWDLRRQTGAYNFTSANNLKGFCEKLLFNPPKGKGFTGAAVPGAKIKAQAGPVSFDTGSGMTASTTTSTSYPISRGTTSTPNEDSWTAINRTAAAAGWRAFECEGTLVVGSDQWLLDNFPSAGIVQEFTPAISNIDGTWDIGMPLGQLTVTAMCAAWPYKPGDHVTVKGMGVFDGEWYVYAMQRDLFNPQGSMTLQKPMTPEQFGWERRRFNMSDPATWNRKMIVDQLGVFVTQPTIVGLVEAKVVKVGTAVVTMANQPPQTMHAVMFSLPNTYGEDSAFGPAPYQPVPGWTPSVGDVCLVMCTGNGAGRPFVIAFPTATPS